MHLAWAVEFWQAGGMKPPVKPRRRYFSEPERVQWVTRFRSGRLTQAQFAEQNGLKLRICGLNHRRNHEGVLNREFRIRNRTVPAPRGNRRKTTARAAPTRVARSASRASRPTRPGSAGILPALRRSARISPALECGSEATAFRTLNCESGIVFHWPPSRGRKDDHKGKCRPLRQHQSTMRAVHQ